MQWCITSVQQCNDVPHQFNSTMMWHISGKWQWCSSAIHMTVKTYSIFSILHSTTSALLLFSNSIRPLFFSVPYYAEHKHYCCPRKFAMAPAGECWSLRNFRFFAEENDGGQHGMWIHEKAIVAVCVPILFIPFLPPLQRHLLFSCSASGGTFWEL